MNQEEYDELVKFCEWLIKYAPCYNEVQELELMKYGKVLKELLEKHHKPSNL